MQRREPSISPNQGGSRSNALNEALERLSEYRYLDGAGFACHGPMAAEALSTLGYDQQVPAWVERYKGANVPIGAPPAKARINLADPASWRPALGDPLRASDWEAAFADRLQSDLWQDVLRQWAPVLIPGYAGGLTHGLLRVAHCVRALPTDGSQPSTLMLTELARGLALWASTYTVLPGSPSLSGRLALPEALRALPRPDEPWTLMEAGTFARIGEVGGFPGAVDALGPPASIDQALSDLSETFSGLLLAAEKVFPPPLVHAVTPIAAVRTLLPYLETYSTEAIYGQLWHVDAGIVTAFSAVFKDLTPGAWSPPGTETSTEAPGPEELAARAVEHGDPHVVKFTEAAIRENACRPSDVYLLAARAVIDRVPPL